MAYKFSKGKRGFGDITFEEDPDTGIDFEDDTVKIETGGAERVIVNNTGLGVGGTPSTNLHVKGNDARVRIDGDIDSHPGLELSENGARKWITYNDYANDNLTFKTNTTIRMSIQQDGAVNVPISLRTPLIEFTDGDNAITIEDGGLLKIDAGIKYNRSVQVSTYVSPTGICSTGGHNNRTDCEDNSGTWTPDGGWIKFATFNCPGTSNLDTAASTFLITLAGFESSTNRKISGLFMVHARFTNNNAGNGNGGSDYYDTDGTYLYCDPWNADHMSGTGNNAPVDFNPATDLLMIFTNDDTTPVVDLYIKSCAKDKHCFVTHLGSSSNTSATDAGWDIVTGQSWLTTEPAAPGGSVKVGGTWSSKIFSAIDITGKTTLNGDLKVKGAVYNDVTVVDSFPYTVAANDYILLIKGSGARTINFPAKANELGRTLIIKDALGNFGSGTVTLDGNGNETIDGQTTKPMAVNWKSMTFVCGPDEWHRVSEFTAN